MTASADLRHRAVLMLLVANACWGLSFPLMKALGLVQQQLAPESGSWFTTATMVAPRFILAALVIAIGFGRSLARFTRAEWRQGLGLGLFASLGMLFQADGIQYTDASTSAFLTQFYAILIPVYLALRSRRSPGFRVWLAAGLVLVGVAVLGRFDWRALTLGRGEAETLLASVFFMGQILWLERPEFAGNRPLRITLVMFLVEGLAFLGLGAFTAPSAAAVVAPLLLPAWWGLTIGLTVFCTLGAFILMNTWQPRITATEAGLIYCVEPIFGSVFALFLPGWFAAWALIQYPNETATTHLLIGGGLITLANVIVQLRSTTTPPRELAAATAGASRLS
jgi:drug/metabolite transporter (DMT)-like permease